MIRVPANIPLPFEKTMEPGLAFPAMRVYEVTSGSPVLVATIPMVEVDTGTYYAEFTAVDLKRYVVKVANFTDNTYTTIDTDQPTGSDSFVALAETSGGGSGSSKIIGEIKNVPLLLGQIKSSGLIRGVVTDEC